MTYFVAGAILGLAGSLHCAVMCGPLVLAMNPTARLPRQQACLQMLGYHAGRLLTYALLGGLVGSIGEELIPAGIGRGLAVGAGALLVLAAAGATIGTGLRPIARAWSSLALLASSRAIAFARRHHRLGHAVLGAANGLLPCGLLYAALAAAVSSGGVIHSVALMIGFGSGTIPMLLALTMSAATIPATVRQRFRLVLPAVMALAGVLLIARGIQPVGPAAVRHSATSILSHRH